MVKDLQATKPLAAWPVLEQETELLDDSQWSVAGIDRGWGSPAVGHRGEWSAGQSAGG